MIESVEVVGDKTSNTVKEVNSKSANKVDDDKKIKRHTSKHLKRWVM